MTGYPRVKVDAEGKPRPSYETMWAEMIGLYALTVGIADTDYLSRVLRHGLIVQNLYATGGGLARTAGGEFTPVTTEIHDRHTRISDLLATLENELAEAPRPLSDGNEYAALRTAIEQYARHLDGISFSGPEKQAHRPKSPVTTLALALAHAWPRLTGKEPKAWLSGATGKPGGRYYDALQLACRMFGLVPPSVKSTREVLAHNMSKPRRNAA